VSVKNLLQRVNPFAVLSVTVPLLVYLLTLAPSVTFFDSGEFITAISSLGTAHSPGYPLFINYAKAFTWLPFGSIAFRVNLATAVSATAACYMVYLLVSHLLANEDLVADKPFSKLGKNTIALAAALTFAFSARLWLQSNHDKPYPLIAFLSALIFYQLLLWRDSYVAGTECPAYIYLGAFLCGLAFGAHQTMILLLPTYALLILAMDWRLIGRVKELVLAFAFAILGFSIHLHMPIRAMNNPLLNWGDPKTFSQFLWNLLRKGYPVEKPARTLQLVWAQINAFNVPAEFTWVGLAILLFGLAAYIRRQRDVVLAYLLGIFFFLLVIAGYLNTPREMIFLTEEFFTPLYLLTAVFIGLGIFHLLKIGLVSMPLKLSTSLPVKFIGLCIVLLLPATVCALHYVENDQHENYIAHDYATNTLRSLPQGAVLFTWGDSGAFPLWYLQGVERMRDDLDLLHTPHLVFSWYLDSFPELFRSSVLRTFSLENLSPDRVLLMAVDEQMARRPVFIDFSTRYSIEFPTYSLRQKGICYELIPKTANVAVLPDSSIWNIYIQRGIAGEMFFRDLDTGKAILIYANSHMEAGEALMSLGHFGEGLQELKTAARISPELRMQITQILAGYGVH
jgi:4-amino-4-deoxy-L-arabinose transferase-like glycosyltransferase